MWRKGWNVVIIILLLTTLGILMISKNEIKNEKSITVWTRFKPSSTDPLDYDLAVHHEMMRSVYASLVSLYSSGNIEAQIAKSWSTNSEKTEWRMVIDPEWSFGNDEKITPEIVSKNFKRVILIKNRSNSKSGLLEFLENCEELTSLNDEISGLNFNNTEVIFKFVKPMPDFLEKVSFGLYGIAHPNDYDLNGNWVNKKKIISSGAYEISKWNEEEFIISLRSNLKHNLKIEKMIPKVIFTFSQDYSEIDKADIMFREKYNPLIDEKLWKYGSTRLDNDITYVKVMKWDQKNNYLSKRENRAALRSVFYSSLKSEGLNVTTSFFPLTIKGIKSFEYSNTEIDLKGISFTSQPYFYSNKKTLNGKRELGLIYEDGFKTLCKRVNAIPAIVDYPENVDEERNVFDIQFLGTGILIDDPVDDVKFMFLSKQGIQLPDETGEILQELKKEKIDVQKVNQLLWDQAIIWPIRHSSSGFWVKRDSNIDLSLLNTTLHPIDFQFVRWN